MWESLPLNWHVVGVGDFNGDGKSDILLRSDDGYLTEWLGASDGSLVDNGDNSTEYFTTDWQVQGAGDINGDGKSDFLLRSTSGGWLTEWLGSDGGGFVNNGATSTEYFTTDWQVAGIGDFNGDGRDDFLLRDTAGQLTEYLGAADGSFVNNGPIATAFITPDWHVAGIGDFNGDGRSDFLLRNDNGQVTDWLGTANGSFVNNGANFSVSLSNDWSLAGVGDFNGDGKSDLLWRDSSGTITDWLGQSMGDFADNSTAAYQPLDTSIQIDGVGDFNGDGKADVLLRESDGSLETWIGSANGAILTEDEQLWQIAVANVSQFFDDVDSHLSVANVGPPMVTYTQDSAIPLDGGLAGFDPNIDGNGSDQDGFPYSIYSDSTFQVVSVDDTSFSAYFDGNFGSMTELDDSSSTYLFNMNGLELVGDWLPGSPPAPQPDTDAIVITGQLINSDESGYLIFSPTTDDWSDLASAQQASEHGSEVGLNATGESVTPFLAQPHMAPDSARHLTQREKIAIAGYTNLTDDELDAIIIHAGGQFLDGTPWADATAATTWSDTNISFNQSFALTDFSNDPDTLDLLIHELYHVYQWDTIGAARVIGDQAGRVFGDTYTYSSNQIQASIDSFGTTFENMNVEAQAQVAEDFYRIDHGLAPMGAIGFTPTAEQLNSGLHFRLPH